MRHLITLLAAVVILISVSACSSSSASPTAVPSPQPSLAPASLTVGLVTDIGGLNDRSFNHLAYLGLQRAAARWHVHTQVLQSHSEQQYAPNLTRMVDRGVGLIFAVGFSMRGAVYTVASSHPDTRFALIDAAPVDPQNQTHNLPNVANVFFKEQEAGYLVGVIAGLMERDRVGKATHGSIGYMGGASIPPVDRYLAGYVAGAHRVNPSVKIVGDYSESFTDTAAGQQIGARQIAEGADILFQVAAQSGLGYLSSAQQHGVYGIGVDADQSYLSPIIITSALKKVDVAVQLLVQDVLKGRFRGGDHRYGASEGATGFARPSPVVPNAIVTAADQYEAKIARGQIVPPQEIPRY